MILSIKTLTITAPGITTFIIMAFSMTALSIITIGTTIKNATHSITALYTE